jgi:hypothetical protein
MLRAPTGRLSFRIQDVLKLSDENVLRTADVRQLDGLSVIGFGLVS